MNSVSIILCLIILSLFTPSIILSSDLSCSTVIFHNQTKLPKMSLKESISTLITASCSSIDLTAYCKNPGICLSDKNGDLEKHSDWLKKNKIKINSIHFGAVRVNNLSENLKDIKRAIEVAKIFNTSKIVAPVDRERDKTTLLTEEEAFSTLRLLLIRLKPYLEKEKMVLGLENHAEIKWLLRTGKDFKKISDLVDKKELFFVLDLGHSLKAGDDPYKVISEFKPKIGMIHLKDFDGKNFCFPEKGILDYTKLAFLLKGQSENFNYSVELEVHFNKSNFFPALTKLLKFYKKQLSN